jgi:putative transposase
MLLQWLARRAPDIDRPAPSTAGDLLAREGLVEKRRRRRPHYHPGVVAPVTHAPNDLWTADFKGHFRTRDGIYCYPLTIADLHTRYLLTCQGLRSTKGHGVRASFEQALRAHGLPRAIRTDNGVPFATTGIHGLSQLNVWWMRLGIQHQRSRPATPQDNAAHEHMHKTLKAGAIRPPRGSLAAQQRAFNSFRREYNDERPHQYLRGRAPGDRYHISSRPFPEQLPPLEYPGHFLVKRITTLGPSASNAGCCSSPTPSSSTTLAWRRSTTGSGPSTSIACSSPASTSATMSSGTDPLNPAQCHPCSRFTLLPMSPVAHHVYLWMSK